MAFQLNSFFTWHEVKSYCFILMSIVSPPLRYQECHPEHGGSYCGSRGTKSSLCYHATGRVLLWGVPEGSAPVGRSCGHHPAQEHVCYAPGHSTGEDAEMNVSCVPVPSPFPLRKVKCKGERWCNIHSKVGYNLGRNKKEYCVYCYHTLCSVQVMSSIPNFSRKS